MQLFTFSFSPPGKPCRIEPDADREGPIRKLGDCRKNEGNRSECTSSCSRDVARPRHVRTRSTLFQGLSHLG